MAIGETIPTIAELKGNTILELFKNGYNALKNALFRKQNKLVAGDNIVIDENTNRISAIVGGEPVLDDYYTKTEVDEIATELSADINDKADADDVYTKSEVYNKTEVDNIVESLEGEIEIIVPTLSGSGYKITFEEEINEGDIVVCNLVNINNNKVCSFVTTPTNTSERNKSTHSILSFSRIDATEGSFTTNNFTLYRRSAYQNIYEISGYTTGIEFNDNVVTILEGENISLSATNSKVTIYRRKTE